MQNLLFSGLLACTLGAITLGACASTPKAEEVCTAGWVADRTGLAVDNIYNETSDTAQSLKKIGAIYLEGKSPNIFQLFSLSSKVKGLEKELLRGQGMKDLKTLAMTCDDPRILTNGIASYVDRLELPEKMRAFMEDLPEYKDMVAKNLKDLTR